jgi:hypothetical protein
VDGRASDADSRTRCAGRRTKGAPPRCHQAPGRLPDGGWRATDRPIKRTPPGRHFIASSPRRAPNPAVPAASTPALGACSAPPGFAAHQPAVPARQRVGSDDGRDGFQRTAAQPLGPRGHPGAPRRSVAVAACCAAVRARRGSPGSKRRCGHFGRGRSRHATGSVAHEPAQIPELRHPGATLAASNALRIQTST